MTETAEERAQAVMAEAHAMFEGHNPLRCQAVMDAMVAAGGGELTMADIFMLGAMFTAKGLSLTLSPQRSHRATAVLMHANSKCAELDAERMQVAELAVAPVAGTG